MRNACWLALIVLAGTAGCVGTAAAPRAVYREPVEQKAQLQAYGFGPVNAHLNVQEMNSYVRLGIILHVRQMRDDQQQRLMSYSSKTKPGFWTRKEEIVDWLLLYLADKKPDDFRGSAALEKIRREITVGLNELFWPGQKGRIEKLLFSEINVHKKQPS